MESSTESQEARERLESWKRQQRDHGRLCYGPTTAEVLGDSPDDYPPSLNEAGFATRPWFKQKHLQLLLDLLLDGTMKLTASMPPAWDVSKDFAVMNMLLQFNDELPLTVGADHHVYAVSTFHEAWPTSFRHWSFYTQGHFFHLSAPGLDKNPSRQGNISGSAPQKTRVRLKHEDFSTPETPDSVKARENPFKVALIAYQVGKTRYTPEKLLVLANWIIEHLQLYDIFEVNCQFFMRSLLFRTIMTSRDCSVFTGTASQIAQWDLHGRETDERVFDFEHGYLLSAPRSKIFHSLWMTPPFVSCTTFGQKSKAHAMSKLYRGGMQGRFRRSSLEGKGGLFNGIFQDWRRENRISCQYLRRATIEFVEDLKARRWQDAFVGRPETRIEYEALLKREREGRVTA